MKIKTVTLLVIVFLLSTSLSFAKYTISFTPRLTVSEEYTDNLYQSEVFKESDFITTITPGFDLEISGRNSGLTLLFDTGYSIYSEFSENNAWRNNVGFDGWVELSRNIRFDLSNDFVRTEDPLSDEDIVALRGEEPIIDPDPTGGLSSREPYSTNSTSLRSTYQFGPNNSAYMEYVYDFRNSDDPSIEEYNNSIPSVGLEYWLSPEWGVEAEFLYQVADFDISDDFKGWNGTISGIKRFTRSFEMSLEYIHTIVDFEEQEDITSENYNIYEPSIGLIYTFSEDMSLSLNGGYAIIDFEINEEENFLTAGFDLQKSFRNGAINIIGTRGYTGTYFGLSYLGLTEFNEIGLTSNYSFNRYWSGNIFGFYRNADYIQEVPEREDDIWRGGIGLAYRPLNWLETALNYSYQTVDSTDIESEYDENVIFFSVTLSTPRPYQWAK